jgi:rubrerythrin
VSQIAQAIPERKSRSETTSDRAAIIAARRSGPIQVDIENLYTYSLQKVSTGYCHFCGHVHDRDHSCRDRPLCEETEKQNAREYINASRSYRRRTER